MLWYSRLSVTDDPVWSANWSPSCSISKPVSYWWLWKGRGWPTGFRLCHSLTLETRMEFLAPCFVLELLYLIHSHFLFSFNTIPLLREDINLNCSNIIPWGRHGWGVASEAFQNESHSTVLNTAIASTVWFLPSNKRRLWKLREDETWFMQVKPG